MRRGRKALIVGVVVAMLLVVGLPPLAITRAFAQAAPPCSIDVPMPDGFNVAASGPSSAGEIGWHGAYEGIWDGNLPSRFVIERIDGTSAHIVYAWGDEPTGAFKAGFSRFAATLRDDGAIQWGPENGRFVFRQDGETALGELTRPANVYRATMQRCSVAALMPPPDLAAAPNVGDPVYSGLFTGPGLAPTYRCQTGRNVAEVVDEGYIHKVTGRCQEGQNSPWVGTGAFKALQMGDGGLRFDYKAVTGRDRLYLQARFRLQEHPSNAVGYVIAVRPAQGIVELLRQVAPNQAMTLDGRSDLGDRLATDDWIAIGARAQGSSLFVLLNDEPVLAAVDTAFDRGSFQVVTGRQGNLEDTAETAVVWRNLQVSPLVGGDPARGPTFQRP